MNSSGLTKRRLGLNKRLSLGVAAVVLAATFAIATIALHLVKFSMEASIASDQLERVSYIADAVDQKLASRRTTTDAMAPASSASVNAPPQATCSMASIPAKASLRGYTDPRIHGVWRSRLKA
jgi:Flp pilus assembly protein TadG